MGTGKEINIPKNDGPVLGTTASVFPSSGGQSRVYGASSPTIRAGLRGGKPCVGDNAGASIEPVGL